MFPKIAFSLRFSIAGSFTAQLTEPPLLVYGYDIPGEQFRHAGHGAWDSQIE